MQRGMRDDRALLVAALDHPFECVTVEPHAAAFVALIEQRFAKQVSHEPARLLAATRALMDGALSSARAGNDMAAPQCWQCAERANTRPKQPGHATTKRVTPQYEQVLSLSEQGAPQSGQWRASAVVASLGTTTIVPQRHRARAPARLPLTS